MSTLTILIAYDGSEDSRTAIRHAATLFPGASATVLTVWQHLMDSLARAGTLGTVVIDYDAIDTSTEEGAGKRAAEGAELARTAGFGAVEAESLVLESDIAHALLEAAEQLGADAIVAGSRGLGTVRGLLLGSVSTGLLHHAEIPVVVVPHHRAA